MFPGIVKGHTLPVPRTGPAKVIPPRLRSGSYRASPFPGTVRAQHSKAHQEPVADWLPSTVGHLLPATVARSGGGIRSCPLPDSAGCARMLSVPEGDCQSWRQTLVARDADAASPRWGRDVMAMLRRSTERSGMLRCSTRRMEFGDRVLPGDSRGPAFVRTAGSSTVQSSRLSFRPAPLRSAGASRGGGEREGEGRPRVPS